MSVHLEGMGWLGSMLARQLTMEGIDFTWHDTDRWACAWPASTGLVYPTFDPPTVVGYNGMRRWVDGNRHFAQGEVEQCTWWYTSNAAPGINRAPKGTSAPKPLVDQGWVRAAVEPAWQVNVQQVVHESRRRFERHRVVEPPDADAYVVAHGFDPSRVAAFSWGWSCKTRVTWPDEIAQNSVNGRPVLYAKTGRWIANYLYPVAGEPDTFWAGSIQIHQRDPQPLEVSKHWVKWNERVKLLTGGRVSVEQAEPFRQGWRPKPGLTGHDPVRAWHAPVGRQAIFAPSLAASGLRLAAPTIERMVDMIRRDLGG